MIKLQRIKNIRRTLLDIVFPRRCAVCAKVISDGAYLCGACEKEYTKAYKSFDICGKKAFTACDYGGICRNIVLNAKQSRDGYKLDFMAYEIYRCLARYGMTKCADVIVPVPMHFKSKLKRGYNQSAQIAKELSRLLCVPYADALRKTRATFQQKRLNARQRRENLIGSFAISDNSEIKGRRVLVIDDVITTGATVGAVYAAIKGECADIVFAAYAKTPPPDKKSV